MSGKKENQIPCFPCAMVTLFLFIRCYHVVACTVLCLNMFFQRNCFRYTIVLQIFKIRAQTKEAKLQVALAELPYFRYMNTNILKDRALWMIKAHHLV